jgi:hypothetical protein
MAWLGVGVIGASVIAYATRLALVGAGYTSVPETPPGSGLSPSLVFLPVPIGPVLFVAMCGCGLLIGSVLAWRGRRLGPVVALAAAAGLTVFGIVFIFGAFGLTFFAGVVALLLITALLVLDRLDPGSAGARPGG